MSNNLFGFICSEHLSGLRFPSHMAGCNSYVWFNRFSNFMMFTFCEAKYEKLTSPFSRNMVRRCLCNIFFGHPITNPSITTHLVISGLDFPASPFQKSEQSQRSFSTFFVHGLEVFSCERKIFSPPLHLGQLWGLYNLLLCGY